MGGANVAYHDTMADLSFESSNFGDFNMFGGDGFTAINTAPGTVSPKDLMNGGDSVPPSTAFTNLTTPGSTYLETPDSYEASPLFNDSLPSYDFGTTGSNGSFFPDLDCLAPQPMGRTASASSVNQIVVHPGGPAQARKRSSIPASPLISSPRPSSVAGVNAKKRDKPLPPIMVDETDPVALKRARNTAAARKSRARKVEERDVLEARIAELEAQLAQSETEKADVSGERDYWKARAEASVSE